MNRLVGIAAASLWLVAMTLLVRRDLLPFWTAQDAPAQAPSDETFQVAIRNAAGVRLGTTWVRMAPTQSITTVRSTTFLDLRSATGVLAVPGPMIFDTNLAYQTGGVLDQFRLRVEGAPLPIQVVGERCRSDFACTITFGTLKKTLSLDGRLTEYLSETLRPFTHLENLRVGQRWRIRLLDPISLLRGGNLDLKMQVVTVTKREAISHDGRQTDCFRVETEGAVAWVDESGRVLRQEVLIPLLGKWTLTDEPYDPKARIAALAMVNHEANASPASNGLDPGPDP